MRAFLLFIGWSSIISSFVDGALGFYALWIISSSEITDFYLSLDVNKYSHWLVGPEQNQIN